MISLSKITGKYVGLPFADMPCFKLVSEFYRELGYPYPDEWEGWTVETALELWKVEPEKAIPLMLKFYRQLWDKAEGRLRVFDLVVIKSESYYPSIYVGRNKILASYSNTGVEVAALGEYNQPFIVRRFQV